MSTKWLTQNVKRIIRKTDKNVENGDEWLIIKVVQHCAFENWLVNVSIFSKEFSSRLARRSLALFLDLK